MRRFLVTGGAGFIGSHIACALLRQGAFVRILDNLSTGTRANLDALRGCGASGQMEFLEADVRDPVRVAEAVQAIDIIFHEAAFVSVPESMERPQECFDVNISGTTILLEAARKAGVGRAVLASSAAVYGDAGAPPLVEDGPTRPLSPYAASKISGEILGGLYTEAFGLPVVSLRYFNVYGPRQRPDSAYAAVVPVFIRELQRAGAVTVYGDGRQTRDLIFVEDVVHANLLAAEHPAAAGQVLNVCTGQPTRVLDLLEALTSLMPGAPPPRFEAQRPGDIYESLGSPAAAESRIGFRAATSLLDGLRACVDGVR
jgi:UDP-glucose 4-epimerase